jgi:transcriptional regulator with XRE-family HTH domain
MPRPSRLNLPPLDYGVESLGQRLTRFRRERGLTQAQLAEKIGILQTLITDYEHDRLRLSAEMAVRFALALDVSLDEWLLPKPPVSTQKKKRPRISRAIIRRMELLDLLPPRRRRDLLIVLDTILRGVQKDRPSDSEPPGS